MNFKEELEKRKSELEEILEKYLPAEEGFCKELAQAMNYSMRAGGKRLRPLLMAETYKMFGGTSQIDSAVSGGNRDDSYLFADSR